MAVSLAGSFGRRLAHHARARSAPSPVAVLNKWVGNATSSTRTTVIAAAQSALCTVIAFCAVGKALSVPGEAKCVADFSRATAPAETGGALAGGAGVGHDLSRTQGLPPDNCETSLTVNAGEFRSLPSG